MTPDRSGRFRDALLAVAAVVLVIGALRVSYPVAMPLLFAGVIVAALWPLKAWLDRRLPAPLGYLLSVLALIALLAGFAAAVYFAVGQVAAVLGGQWTRLETAYLSVADWAAGWGLPLNRALDQRRVVGFVQMLVSGLYGFVTYVGFIGILVMLGLPEVPRLRAKATEELDGRSRAELLDVTLEISRRVRSYLGTTLATSALTGVASALWSFATGLELALVWGLLNFLLNFIPVIGNIVGVIPPVLYAFLQFDGWTMPLVVLGGFAALQLVISNFIYPWLQGRGLSLSPLAVVVSMTFWTWLWGIAGALIAVPVTAALVIVCGQFDRSRWFARLLSA